MIQCRICGCKFDEKNVKPCGCSCAFGGCHGNNVRCPNCGCGGNNVLCPNCGYEVRLPRTNIPKKPKKEEEMGFMGKLMSKLRMGN